jgi:chromosomal replication initiation ATPase DnaA
MTTPTDYAVLEARIAELERIIGIGVPRLAPVGAHFVRDLVYLVARETGVSSQLIMSGSRVLEHALARFVVIWVARESRAVNYSRIGRVLGRDHSTIMHGEQRAIELRKINPDFRALTDTLLAAVRQPQP